MQTRSQTIAKQTDAVSYAPEIECEIPPKYEVNIDFDEASKAWRKNKTSIGNGSYKYKKEKRRRFPEVASFPLI